MKKFFLFIVLSPILSFGAFNYSDDIQVRNMYTFIWTSFGVSSTRVSSPCYSLNSYDEMYSTLTSSTFGLYIRTQNLGAMQISFIAPSGSPVFVPGNLNSGNVTNSIYCITGGVNCCVSPLYFPNLASVYGSVAALFVNGYRGSGIVDVFSGSSGRYCINVDYPALVSDVVSSTNTVFRQILLSSLSSISSGVASIAEYTFDSAGYLNSIDLSSHRILLSVGSISNSVVSIDQDMDILIDRVGDVLDKVSSDPFVNDFTNAVNALLSSGKISQDQANSFLSGYSSLSSPTAKAVFALSFKENINASQFAKDFISTAAQPDMSSALVTIGQSLGADVVDALIGDYPDSPTRGSKAYNTRSSIKSQLQSWRAEAKQQLQDWKTDLSNQLQDWKTSDETGYLNVRSGIDDVRSSIGSVDSHINTLFDPANANGPAALDYSNNYISNVTRSAASDISTAVSNAVRGLTDSLFDGDHPLDVRITFPIYGKDHAEVGVHDESVYQMLRGLPHDIMHGFRDVVEDGNFPSWSVHVDNFNEFLDGWLEEWRRWVGEDTFYQLAQSFYDFKGIWETNALPFFADYRSSFIQEDVNFYKSAFDIVRHSSQSNLLSRLCFYGLSQQPNQGNFFDLFTSFVLLQSEIASTFLDTKDLIDDISSSSSWFDGLSVFEASKQVVDSIPSRSQIEQMVTTATHGTNLVLSSSTDLFDQFGLMTNLHSHAFSVFKSSSTSLPDHIVLFRFKTSLGDSGSSFRDVSIPVGTVPNLWLVIRLSIAFGICAVNLILFPKFLLKLALLFMPLFKKSLPFLNASA